MLREKKKISLIVTLLAIAFLIHSVELLSFVLHIYYKELSEPYLHFLYEIRIINWGWLVAFISAVTAIGITLYWKPGRAFFRRIVIFLSVVAILLSANALFWLMVITNLPT